MMVAMRVARLRPALAAALAGAGPLARRAVHPLLRARRAGPPRDAVARLHRHDARGRPPMSTPVLDVRGLAYAYPDGHQALFGVDLHVHRGERVALLGPNGAGKTTLVLHLNGILTAGAGTVAVSGLPVDEGEPRRRSGAGSASSSRTPTTSCSWARSRQDVAFGPANLGLTGAELDAPGAWTRSTGSGWPTSPTGRRTTSPSASAAGSRSRPCWRWSRRSWCSTSRPPTSTRPRAASSPTSCARSTSRC